MLQVAKFLLQLQIIPVCIRQFFIQQPGLPQKEGFYLKEIIPVLIYRTKRQTAGPCFKGIPIQPETKVAGQGDKEYIFPMIIASLQPGGNHMGFLLETFYLQSRKPGMDC